MYKQPRPNWTVYRPVCSSLENRPKVLALAPHALLHYRLGPPPYARSRNGTVMPSYMNRGL